MAKTVWPASENQLAFLAKLVGERDVTGVEMWENPGWTEAKKMIDALLCAPRKPLDKPLVQLGYYLLGDQVYVVVPSKNKVTSYAKRQVLQKGKQCRWEYEPGAIFKLEKAIPLTLQEAAQFGHLNGYCLCCGRNLSDPKSVQMGIGPVCAKKFGVLV